MSDRTGILLIQCPDQKGILASVCQFLANHQGNIISLQEHADTSNHQFFSRIEWEMNDFLIQEKEEFNRRFQNEVGEHYAMNSQFYFSDEQTTTCLFVSKYSHCLEDILYRHSSGELNINIPLIISNHQDLEPLAKQYSIPYYHIPVTKKNKADQERKQRQLIEKHNCDLIVLARYMQILTPDFVSIYKNKIINIHHSFLPAFTGARPYHAAYDRGVKMIGATAHFVTSELDEGPIICQNITKITHRDSAQEMIVKGKDTEKMMLSRAVRLYSQHKLLANGNRTIVFE